MQITTRKIPHYNGRSTLAFLRQTLLGEAFHPSHSNKTILIKKENFKFRHQHPAGGCRKDHERLLGRNKEKFQDVGQINATKSSVTFCLCISPSISYLNIHKVQDELIRIRRYEKDSSSFCPLLGYSSGYLGLLIWIYATFLIISQEKFWSS